MYGKYTFHELFDMWSFEQQCFSCTRQFLGIKACGNLVHIYFLEDLSLFYLPIRDSLTRNNEVSALSADIVFTTKQST